MTIRPFTVLDILVGDTVLPLYVSDAAPVNGTSGTLAGAAIKGALLIYNGALYQNTNTQASPTWSVGPSGAAVVITGGTIDGTPIGGTAPAAVKATTLSASGLTSLAGVGSSVPQQSYAAVSTAPTVNVLALTGANVCGGSVATWLNLTATLSAGAAATLPTVANLITAMQAAGLNPIAGGTYELNLMNSSSGNFAWTITTNTGWSALTGTMTVAQNTYRKCIVTFGAGLTAAALQSVGQYAIGSAP